jgi:pyruvate-formate lyase-activating enzyme
MMMTDRPKLALDIALTTRCPLHCRYCTVERTPVAELTADQWIAVISSLARLRPIERISLEGGEPFLRADLAAILQASLDHAGAVKVVTSGSLPCHLPERLAADPRFHIDLSMDGPPEAHDFLRDGSYRQAGDFLRTCLHRGIRVHLRTVISRHNLAGYEEWLREIDRSLEGTGGNVKFSFDTLIAPQALAAEGGTCARAGIRQYDVDGLLPSPGEIWGLFGRLRKRVFNRLAFQQKEPLRGCGAARCGSISLDPAGRYSFCCEAPRGFGSILDDAGERCLSLLDQMTREMPCGRCAHFRGELCSGCWTGLKCGMVTYWGAENCQALLTAMTRGEGTALPFSGFPNPLDRGPCQQNGCLSVVDP